MTNSWTDIGVSDCVLIMGSNTAENHPVAMKWVLRAKDRGGKVIHVDPRYTRTSTKAIFDMETVFLFAWSVAVKQAGWMGFFEALIFIGILIATLIYLAAVGALDW